LLERAISEKPNSNLIKAIEIETNSINVNFDKLNFTRDFSGTKKEWLKSLLVATLIHRVKDILEVSEDLCNYFKKGYLTKEEIYDLNRRFNQHKIDEGYVRKKLSSPISFIPDNLFTTIDTLVFIYNKFFEEKNIKVNLNVQSINFNSPRTFLSEIITELLKNAIYHTPFGGTINVSGKVIDNRVVIFIEDNGVGITDKNLAKLQRGERFTTRETGTGSGLFLIKQLLEEINGSLQIQSELGKGTKVTISLPFRPTKYVPPFGLKF